MEHAPLSESLMYGDARFQSNSCNYIAHINYTDNAFASFSKNSVARMSALFIHYEAHLN